MKTVLKPLSTTKRLRRQDYKRFGFVATPSKDESSAKDLYKRGVELERQLAQASLKRLK